MPRTTPTTDPSTPQAAPEPTRQSHQNAGATPSEPSKHQMTPAMADTFEMTILLSKMQGLVDLGLIVDQNLIRTSDDPHVLAFANLLYVFQDYLKEALAMVGAWDAYATGERHGHVNSARCVVVSLAWHRMVWASGPREPSRRQA